MSGNENILGKKIKELRKKNGLSQEEFAFRIDVSRQTVYSWETGKAAPDSKKIMIICKAFNIDPNELLFNKKEQLDNMECSADLTENNNLQEDNYDKKRQSSKCKLKLWSLIIIVICLFLVLSLLVVGIFNIDKPTDSNLDKIYSSQWNITTEFVFYVISGIIIVIMITSIIVHIYKILRGEKTDGENKKDNKD